MAGFISQDQIERIRSANDIVDVIGEYVPLKKAGKDYKALCPFHKEKTASFQVSRGKQIFKCFGCGKGGNVFTFVMATERVEFPEAVEMLAKRAGVILERARGGGPQAESRREDLYEVNLWAARAYHRYLMDPDRGARARQYLEKRGFRAEALVRFRLGYAPDNWEFLVGLGGREFRPEQLVRAGLVLPREGGGGYYDRFRDRVIFPILDVRGRIIAFGGRSLGDALPKYLNSPETAVFEKSRSLYGLNWAKDAILAEKRAVVVEGYTDALTLMMAGIEGVVATLGTALSEEHVRQLRRYADETVLLFDGDQAGEAAAERALPVFLAQDAAVKVVLLPGGEDPADFVSSHGAERLRELVGKAEDAFDVKMKLVERRHDLKTTTGKSLAIDEILGVVAQAGSGVRQDILLNENPLLKRLTGQMGITEAALRERLVRMRRGGPAPTARKKGVSLGAYARAERDVVGAMLCGVTGDGAELLLTDSGLKRIAQACAEAGGPEFELSRVLDRFDDAALIQLAVDLQQDVSGRGDPAEVMEAALAALKNLQHREEMLQIRGAMALARKNGDESGGLDLLRQYQEQLRKRGGKTTGQ